MSTMTNRYGGYCVRCGRHVAPGEGITWRDYDEDEDDRPVWRVAHSDRAVCDANIAADNAERARREAFRAHLAAFEARFQDAEYPPEAEVEGETVYDTFSIYGVGSRIVIGNEYVWWVEANGMDGDDWSRNNCRLGIARRLPRTDELVEDARALVTEHEAVNHE
jgi:hypothetical protein